MKIIVTHGSPDMDAITSVWLIKKFLAGWENAVTQFVPAGERLTFRKTQNTQKSGSSDNQKVRQSDLPSFSEFSEVIEKSDDSEVIHVDTGLGPLDHHQTSDTNICGASLTWDFVKAQSAEFKTQTDKIKSRIEAISRMVKVIVDIDHFKEVFRKDPLADYHDFDLAAILDGLKLQFPNQDNYYVEFVSKCLDAIYHEFENRIWAEKEIAENGQKFSTRFGEGIGFETINDSVIKLAQKMGYAVVLRKDPRKGYVRVKAMPSRTQSSILRRAQDKTQNQDIDLTLAYEKLRKMDPDATWYLHVSRKMLLNGSVKNPKMRPTKLGINEIIKVLEKI